MSQQQWTKPATTNYLTAPITLNSSINNSEKFRQITRYTKYGKGKIVTQHHLMEKVFVVFRGNCVF
jgi:hypothetical protein